MNLVVENKFWSWTGSSKVTNEEGELVYKVKGKLFSPTKKKKIYDMEGNLLYVVRNKWFNWFHHTTFVFNAEGEKVGLIKKHKWAMNENTFSTEDFEDDIKITGKMFHRTLNITKNDQIVATLKRAWTVFIDKFTLSTEDVANIPFYVALTIAIDNMKDKRSKQNN